MPSCAGVDPSPAPSEPTAAPRPARKSALAFFGVLLVLFLPGLLAQALHVFAGLVWSELFVFLLPALVLTLGSNLRAVPYLRLGRVRPAAVVLGALCGVAGTLLAMAVMAAAQRVMPRSWIETFDVAKLFDRSLAERVFLAVVATFVAPPCEEIAFRGYLQTTLLARRAPAVAIAGSSLLFAVIHLDPVRFPALLVLGAVFGWLAWRSGSLWPAVAAHAANNGLVSLFAIAAPRAAPEVENPPLLALLGALVLGAAALAPLLAAFRSVAAGPLSPETALVLRDPADPSTRFRPGRVPAWLRLTLLLGLQILLALVLAVRMGLLPGARR
ncbi:CPBP family intramembrane glutamic endopeptidase [Anaeromyxobacter sp. SG26]|uniref:CPBP family intramembrane glutamic endopeptidase n=1 Tax=Anaeromyxobacter sp. SG26 TaxID=2925407 RepID=UPI001F584A88|nr:CPBP family intramembrane glutamic endopeptidase [Anaeromyxobacter sp. SG26]